jgi:pimeloyl-ACP methyl ester carboxylesterase
MPYVVINRNPECKLYYELLGNANASIRILFVMGLNMSHRAWMKQVDHFKDGDDIQLCHFDNRGVHRSSAPPGPYSTELMAKDALILAADIGWTQFHLVGVSMGGMISQRMSAIAPERVLSLTLIATRPGGGFLNDLPTLSGISKFLSLRGETDKHARMPKALRLLFPEHFLDAVDPADPQGRTFRESIGEQFLKLHDEEPATPLSGTEAQTKAAISHSLDAAEALAIRNARIPVLILHGESDELIKVSNADALNKMLGGKLVKYPNVGHGINVQVAAEVNAEIETHIRAAHAAGPREDAVAAAASGTASPRANEQSRAVVGENGTSTTVKIKTKRPSERQITRTASTSSAASDGSSAEATAATSSQVEAPSS